jgi:hypothetical protein
MSVAMTYDRLRSEYRSRGTRGTRGKRRTRQPVDWLGLTIASLGIAGAVGGMIVALIILCILETCSPGVPESPFPWPW